MNVEEAIADFAGAGDALLETSMRWALDHWEKAGPRFVELLGHYADGEDRSPATQEALFFAIHLLGEMRERSSFARCAASWRIPMPPRRSSAMRLATLSAAS